MNYRLILAATAALLLTACSGKKADEQQSTEDPMASMNEGFDTRMLDWDNNTRPLPIVMRQVYEDESDDVRETYLFHLLSSELEGEADSLHTVQLAATYRSFHSQQGSFPITYKRFSSGKGPAGAIVGGKYSGQNYGLYFSVPQTFVTDGFALNAGFMASHQVVEMQSFGPYSSLDGDNDDDGTTLPLVPDTLLQILSERYQSPVRESCCCGRSLDAQISVYSVQFQPVDTFCMALVVITEGDSIYCYEDPTDHYTEDGSCWNVDDEGIYLPSYPSLITRGEQGLDIFTVHYAPESTAFSAFMVRGGKVYNYNMESYYVYVDFNPEPDPINLPATAQLKAEAYGYKLWINEDVEPSEECEAGQYSVYYSKPDDAAVYPLLITHQTEYEWGPCMKYVSMEEVQSATDAYLVHNAEYDQVLAIVEGCPDARNVFSYVILLPTSDYNQARWMPVNSGFEGIDEEGKLMKFKNYQYREEGGRYDVIRYYDFYGNLVKEEELE